MHEQTSAPADGGAWPDDLAVTLYLRSGAPTVARRRQAAVRERVAELADAGLDVTVREWGKRATVPGTETDREAVDCYDEFVAAVGDARLEPFFEARRGAGGTTRVVVLPVLCLAVRRAGEVTGLYPCWRDGEHHGVMDGMAALEHRDDPENLT